MAHFENAIDDEEFLLLYDINKSKNPDFPYWNYESKVSRGSLYSFLAEQGRFLPPFSVALDQ